jgi:hypothetical protein
MDCMLCVLFGGGGGGGEDDDDGTCILVVSVLYRALSRLLCLLLTCALRYSRPHCPTGGLINVRLTSDCAPCGSQKGASWRRVSTLLLRPELAFRRGVAPTSYIFSAQRVFRVLQSLLALQTAPNPALITASTTLSSATQSDRCLHSFRSLRDGMGQ